MTEERDAVQDIARIMRANGLIVGRFEAARAVVAAGYRKTTEPTHSEECDMGDDCSC